MSNEELIVGGLKLMVFGMGMVFVFLVIMIWAMKLLEKVLAPFKGMLEPAPKAPAKSQKAGSKDDQLAAVAATAVELFRSK